MTKVTIASGTARAFTLPTERPESDGTIRWSTTTMVLVELNAGGLSAVGYTYTHGCAAQLAQDLIDDIVIGKDALDIPLLWGDLVHAVRNIGRTGLGAMAVSAIDNALWDLKAKLLGISVAHLLGATRERVPVYGSGGFTSFNREQLVKQLSGWAFEGITRVKMKIGLGREEDLERVRAVRESVGSGVEIFVDANEAYDLRTALGLAHELKALNVSWFEQPIANEDLEGMSLLRKTFPPGMQLSTGEYFSDPAEFHACLRIGAADVLQPDATRCLGVTGFLKAAALCEGFNIPVSSHCAPSLHIALGCCVPNFVHLEYFSDHVRFENMFFDYPLNLKNGTISPDWSRPGLGFELKRNDVEKFAS